MTSNCTKYLISGSRCCRVHRSRHHEPLDEIIKVASSRSPARTPCIALNRSSFSNERTTRYFQDFRQRKDVGTEPRPNHRIYPRYVMTPSIGAVRFPVTLCCHGANTKPDSSHLPISSSHSVSVTLLCLADNLTNNHRPFIPRLVHKPAKRRHSLSVSRASTIEVTDKAISARS